MKKKRYAVYPCGTRIKVGTSKPQEDIRGVICRVLIDEKDVSYNIYYWKDRERKCITVCEYEFTLIEDSEPPEKKVGFGNV